MNLSYYFVLRIHIEKSFSRRFQKLHFRKVTASDQGLYVCRGWLGEKHGWDLKSFKLIVGKWIIQILIYFNSDIAESGHGVVFASS
jgi:hypothetical protein